MLYGVLTGTISLTHLTSMSLEHFSLVAISSPIIIIAHYQPIIKAYTITNSTPF